MLSEDEDDRHCHKFFSLYNGMILNKRILKAIEKRCMESMEQLIISDSTVFGDPEIRYGLGFIGLNLITLRLLMWYILMAAFYEVNFSWRGRSL